MCYNHTTFNRNIISFSCSKFNCSSMFRIHLIPKLNLVLFYVEQNHPYTYKEILEM